MAPKIAPQMDPRTDPGSPDFTPGRPRAKRGSAPPSTTCTIRLRATELAALKRAAERLGKKPRTHARDCILGALDYTPALSEDELRALAEVAHQVARIGNNINQIAKAVNEGRAPDITLSPALLEEALERVYGAQRTVTKTVRAVRQRQPMAVLGAEAKQS